MYDALIDEGTTAVERREALDEVGYQLFDASPPIFQNVLWELVDAKRRPRNIYIASVEPTLPWELMIPNWPGREPSRLGPLGVEFAIGRWARAIRPPPQLLPRAD